MVVVVAVSFLLPSGLLLLMEQTFPLVVVWVSALVVLDVLVVLDLSRRTIAAIELAVSVFRCLLSSVLFVPSGWICLTVFADCTAVIFAVVVVVPTVRAGSASSQVHLPCLSRSAAYAVVPAVVFCHVSLSVLHFLRCPSFTVVCHF